MMENPIEGIQIDQNQNNIREFKILMQGPIDSPYEGGLFELELLLPENYPLEAPKVTFKTKIYHPNIDKDGGICQDTFNKSWNPATTIQHLALNF